MGHDYDYDGRLLTEDEFEHDYWEFSAGKPCCFFRAAQAAIARRDTPASAALALPRCCRNPSSVREHHFIWRIRRPVG
jgi:hypothetical protein